MSIIVRMQPINVQMLHLFTIRIKCNLILSQLYYADGFVMEGQHLSNDTNLKPVNLFKFICNHINIAIMFVWRCVWQMLYMLDSVANVVGNPSRHLLLFTL